MASSLQSFAGPRKFLLVWVEICHADLSPLLEVDIYLLKYTLDNPLLALLRHHRVKG